MKTPWDAAGVHRIVTRESDQRRVGMLRLHCRCVAPNPISYRTALCTGRADEDPTDGPPMDQTQHLPARSLVSRC